MHITARTVGGAPWFTEALRTPIVEIICEGVDNGHSKALAVVVMKNHFHLVIRQGPLPLGWMMQRIMQRLALFMKQQHKLEGHVFGRRYWSSICGGPDYLRQAIVYTHLNPWTAELVQDPADYAWSSHSGFIHATHLPAWISRLAVYEGQMLFADESIELQSVISNYLRTIRYWMARRRMEVPGDRFLFEPPEFAPHPRATLGDNHWASNYSHLLPTERVHVAISDTRDRAVALLHAIAPDCTIDMLRTCGRNRQLCAIRRNVIGGLLGYLVPQAAIARCLRVSDSVVSDVASSIRLAS